MKDDDLTIDALAESGAFDPLLEELKNTRRGSRFVAPGASQSLVELVAKGGSYDPETGKAWSVEEPPRGLRGRSSGVEMLKDIQAVRRGDTSAFERLRRSAKDISSGEILVAVETLDGYLPARRAAGPVRDLCTEFEVTSREVRMILEGDPPLEPDWVPEAGLKPSSDTAVVEKISLIYKAAGVCVVADELLADSGGLAEQLVANSFGAAIGRKIDEALLDGDGVGKPLGVLQAPSVNHVTATSQDASDLFDEIKGAVSRLRAKFFAPTAIVMRPEVMLRFETARTATGELLFPNLGQHFDAAIVFDSNLPVAVGGNSSIIVADWKSAMYVLSRGGLVIESSPYPAFESDETTFRSFERVGAAVVQPAAVEVLDGVDTTP